MSTAEGKREPGFGDGWPLLICCEPPSRGDDGAQVSPPSRRLASDSRGLGTHATRATFAQLTAPAYDLCGRSCLRHCSGHGRGRRRSASGGLTACMQDHGLEVCLAAVLSRSLQACRLCHYPVVLFHWPRLASWLRGVSDLVQRCGVKLDRPLGLSRPRGSAHCARNPNYLQLASLYLVVR